MARKNNTPTGDLKSVPAEVCRQITTDLLNIWELPQPKTDEQVEARIYEYFRICESSSVRPGIESLCLAMHISRQTFNNWIHGKGCSPRRQQACEEARQLVISYIEQATESGHLNPASSCFLLKNWAGYRDSAPEIVQQHTEYITAPIDRTAILEEFGGPCTSESNTEDDDIIFPAMPDEEIIERG